MDIITMEKLKTFFDRRPGRCVSLFMPTHRAGRETEQDPIRFKNLLGEVRERLLAKDLRSTEVRSMLKPAHDLLQDPVFWQHQSDGLVVFFTSEEFHFYRLPLPFQELVVISDRFHVKPLLPFFTSDGHFYILALSQNHVRLLECTQHTVDEVDLKSVPISLAEAFQYENFEKHIQFHTGTPSGTGPRKAMFHGHDFSDVAKGKILRWFHMIDEALNDLLTGEKSPVVLAGVEYLFPLYNEANSNPHLLDKGISGNPEELKPDELHERALSLVQPVFMKAQEVGAARYKQLAGSGQTTANVEEAVLAAYHGRVDLLFVAIGVQVWGNFEPDKNMVHIHKNYEPGDEDLLDLATFKSILTGATVYAVEPEEVPSNALLAAVFRY